MDQFTFLYLALMIGLVLGILLLLRASQKGALTMLAQTLYRDGNVKKYLAMLDSRSLYLVLRKSTLALLRLEGHVRAGDVPGVAADEAVLNTIKLRPGERLEFYQRVMSFYLSRAEYEKGRNYLGKLENLLEKEPDEKLRAILADARVLVGVYADRDTALIPALEGQEKTQSGGQKGLTQYRLAKLCHFGGDETGAAVWLKKAAVNLTNTPWQPIVAAAQKNPRVLDER